MQIIQEIIRAIPEGLRNDATIIVHGDHGSRLGLIQPDSAGASDMSVDDYRDAYSTLFAVRSPSLEPAYDSRHASIACLFASLVESEFSADGMDNCEHSSAVFMRKPNGFTQKPLPPFNREIQQSPH
jgi:hypothetical protein